MAIFIDKNTKVVVQGLTGREGQFHALRNRDYGTQVVAGTRPGKAGKMFKVSQFLIPLKKLLKLQVLTLR